MRRMKPIYGVPKTVYIQKIGAQEQIEIECDEENTFYEINITAEYDDTFVSIRPNAYTIIFSDNVTNKNNVFVEDWEFNANHPYITFGIATIGDAGVTVFIKDKIAYITLRDS